MPELPEVETIRMGLQQYLVGHTIERVEVRLPKMVSGEVQLVHGSKVTGVRRYGKGLVIDLSNNHSIAVHVKMTGQLIYQETASNAAAAKETEGGKISEKVGGRCRIGQLMWFSNLMRAPRCITTTFGSLAGSK